MAEVVDLDRTATSDARDLQLKLQLERHRCAALTMELEKRTQESNDLQRKLEEVQAQPPGQQAEQSAQGVTLSPSCSTAHLGFQACGPGLGFSLTVPGPPSPVRGAMLTSPNSGRSSMPSLSLACTEQPLLGLSPAGPSARSPSARHAPAWPHTAQAAPAHGQMSPLLRRPAFSAGPSRTPSTSPVRVKAWAPPASRRLAPPWALGGGGSPRATASPCNASLRPRSQPGLRLSQVITSPRADLSLATAATAASTSAPGIAWTAPAEAVLSVPAVATAVPLVATPWPTAVAFPAHCRDAMAKEVAEKSPPRTPKGAENAARLMHSAELQRWPSGGVVGQLGDLQACRQ